MFNILEGLLLRQTAAAEWEPGRDTAGEQAAAVKHNLQLPHAHALATSIREHVMKALNQSADFLAVALPRRIHPPRINRYDTTHPRFGWHVDNAIRLQHDGSLLRTDLSCTLMLSDPQDYEGGELVMQIADSEHLVKLPAGDAVLYPSTLMHEVRPVTRGERLACFFWVQSLIRQDGDRQLLHTLDMQLVALRRRHGESEETTRLTGVYHALLKRWAES
jgi:PKHD-type hydroxylase